MTENLFTWIPLYTELAQKLLEFEGKQTDLIAMIKQMRDKGLPTISMVDKGRMVDSPTDLPGWSQMRDLHASSRDTWLDSDLKEGN